MPTPIMPYGLPSLSGSPVSNNSLNYLFQPLQQNSSGTLPGTTVQNIGQNMQINANTQQIVVKDSTSAASVAMGKVVGSLEGFIFNDGQNVRVFMGNHLTLGDGFFVSKAGFDAYKATGGQLIFNSAQDIFKIYGTFSTTNANTNNTATHGQVLNFLQNNNVGFADIGFNPQTIAYFPYAGTYYLPLPHQVFITSGTDPALWAIEHLEIASKNTGVQITDNYLISAVGSANNFNVVTTGALINVYLLQETATI